MKIWLATLSNLVIGFLIVGSRLSPLMEMQTLARQKRKVFASLLCGAVSFVFVMASVLLGAFELAVQIEDQGFILWSAMFSLTLIFLALGVGFGGLATALFPKMPEPALENFSSAAIDLIQNLIKQFASHESPSAANMSMSVEPNVAPIRPQENPAPNLRTELAH